MITKDGIKQMQSWLSCTWEIGERLTDTWLGTLPYTGWKLTYFEWPVGHLL